jgi:glycosyltransferase involved in cell wall biosynthesis
MKKKLFIFSDSHWSLGRVYNDVSKQLEDEFEIRFIDWREHSGTQIQEAYAWCDVCITNLITIPFFKNNYPYFNLSKCIFISHGFVEHNNAVYSAIYDPALHYGIASDTIRVLFPENIRPFLMSNGVDPDNFTFEPKDGTLNTLGWCGASNVWWKQVNWAEDISKRTNIPLKTASTLSFEEVKKWYHEIDLLLVTAVPVPQQETGPLPAFEAIVSGIPVIGTPVGNFSYIPGPKFKTIEEAVEIVNELRNNPQKMKDLLKEQYEYVINNYTYKTLVHQWRHAIEAAL